MSNAYEIAKKGGLHSGWCEKMEGLTSAEIRRGIGAFSILIARHQQWIESPNLKVKNWAERDSRYQAGLIKKWNMDILRQKTQRNILRAILEKRGEDE